MTGDIYGDFTVTEMLYGYKYINNKPRTYCRCIGIDGNEYIIRADALRRGATTSIKKVGHKTVAKDITNMRFGYLTALYPTEKRKSNGSVVWHCRCDCGNEVDVSSGSLIREHTRSCGCRHASKWEDFISHYLKSLRVQFETEKRFENCTNSKGSDMLPFDFYLPDYKSLIEYDGQHHFEPIKGWGGEDKFRITQENDRIKNQFCKDNNYNLLRIPFTHSKEQIIEDINLFLQPVEITA